MNPFLTAEECAELLRVPYKTICMMLHNGRLPGKKIGKSWRVSTKALLAVFNIEDSFELISGKVMPVERGMHD